MKKKSNPYIIAIFILAALAAVIIAATSSAFNFNNRRPGGAPVSSGYIQATDAVSSPGASLSADTVQAPDLTGMDYGEANQIAVQAGLRLIRGDDVYSAEYPAGTVLSQNPDRFTPVETGSAITVTLSKGPAPTPTPTPTPSPTPTPTPSPTPAQETPTAPAIFTPSPPAAQSPEI